MLHVPDVTPGSLTFIIASYRMVMSPPRQVIRFSPLNRSTSGLRSVIVASRSVTVVQDSKGPSLLMTGLALSPPWVLTTRRTSVPPTMDGGVGSVRLSRRRIARVRRAEARDVSAEVADPFDEAFRVGVSLEFGVHVADLLLDERCDLGVAGEDDATADLAELSGQVAVRHGDRDGPVAGRSRRRRTKIARCWSVRLVERAGVDDERVDLGEERDVGRRRGVVGERAGERERRLGRGDRAGGDPAAEEVAGSTKVVGCRAECFGARRASWSTSEHERSRR